MRILTLRWPLSTYPRYGLLPCYNMTHNRVRGLIDMRVSTKLLPYYPLGFRLYSQHFLVFWSNYEEFLCEFFGCLPCHTSITKVNNEALVMLVSTQKGETLSERLYRLCFRMIDLGLVNHFWSSKPVYYWVPDASY